MPTYEYAYTAEKRLTKLAQECPWITLADVTAQSFETWRRGKPLWQRKPIKAKTLNQYLDLAQQFCSWLVAPEKKMPSNPLMAVGRMSETPNTGYRRAGSLDEIRRLVAAAPPYRALFYEFVIYVPLRRNTIDLLEWRDLRLAEADPMVVARAETMKARREAKLAIRPDLAVKLIEWRKESDNDGDGDRVFPTSVTIELLRKDLSAAGVAFEDARGQRRLDLHAFRKTCVRLLKDAGVSLDEAHVFLQHRDRRTTEKYYDDDRVAPRITQAAAKMPSLSGPVVAQSVAHSPDPSEGGNQ